MDMEERYKQFQSEIKSLILDFLTECPKTKYIPYADMCAIVDAVNPVICAIMTKRKVIK